MKKKMITIGLVFSIAAALCACGGSASSSEAESKEEAVETTANTEEAEQESEAGEAEESAAADSTDQDSSENAGLRHAEMEIEGYGTVKLELDPNEAPITVENFVKLVDKGFYDGLTFHRIMDGFMIQGGDPLGNGQGGSSETIKGEFSANGVDNSISHKKGVISMARANDPNSASSQFFIMVADGEFLDGNYAAFGWVTEGQEIVDQIAKDAKPVDNNGSVPRDEQPVIISIKMLD